MAADCCHRPLVTPRTREEPNTPLYALPYVGQPPTGLGSEPFVARVRQAAGVPAPAARTRERGSPRGSAEPPGGRVPDGPQ